MSDELRRILGDSVRAVQPPDVDALWTRGRRRRALARASRTSLAVVVAALAAGTGLRLLGSDATSVTTVGPPAATATTDRDDRSSSIVREPLPEVTRVDLAGGVNARLRTSGGPELVARAARRDMNEVEIRVDGGVLHVTRRHDENTQIEDRGPVDIDLSVGGLEEVVVSAGARLALEGVRATDLVLRASSGAALGGDASGDRATVDVSGGGRVEIAGTFRSVEVEAAGGGAADLSSLTAASASAAASGGGHIDLKVTERLDTCSASGGGAVRYTRPRSGVGEVSTSSGGTCEGF